MFTFAFTWKIDYVNFSLISNSIHSVSHFLYIFCDMVVCCAHMNFRELEVRKKSYIE